MSQLYREKGLLIQTGPRLWVPARPLAVMTVLGPVLIPAGFEFDRDSVVRDSPDWLPSIIHDWSYVFQCFLDGSSMSRLDADVIYYTLNRASKEPYNRQVAARNYWGVRRGGWVKWYLPGRPKARSEACLALADKWMRTGTL